METKLYTKIACLLEAMENCKASNNREWYDKHFFEVKRLVKEHMPSGAGLDRGTDIDLSVSEPERLVFNTQFHHMDEHGVYDGWTEHKVTVRPSLCTGIVMTVSGRNRNAIKDHIYECFQGALETVIKD
jgi:hypothetical protein